MRYLGYSGLLALGALTGCSAVSYTGSDESKVYVENVKFHSSNGRTQVGPVTKPGQGTYFFSFEDENGAVIGNRFYLKQPDATLDVPTQMGAKNVEIWFMGRGTGSSVRHKL
jgi:hypothetical protein